MSGWASSFARGACDSDRFGHGLLSIGICSLADVFREFPPTSPFAMVAVAAGGRAPFAFWDSDSGLSDRNDPRANGFG